MKRLSTQHASLSDPVRMAMGYAQEGVEKKRLASALRRVHDDPTNIANPNSNTATAKKSDDELRKEEKYLEYGLAEPTMRRGSFIVDIKRKSNLSYPREQFARYDDAGLVAEAMVRLGADVVFVNVDYHSYGGDMSELKSAIASVRRVNDYAAVVMKDIVVDELQLGLAKEAGADGIVLMASVLGPALENFLNLATVIGLETIVECHTYNEVQAALDALAQNIMVSNRDRITGELVPDQAIKLAGMYRLPLFYWLTECHHVLQLSLNKYICIGLFPGSGGPIVTIAGGGISSTTEMKKLLTAGYDGVVVGRAVMGSDRAPEFIRTVRDRTMLPAEFSSQWGLEDVEFDPDGNVMNGPKKDIPTPEDPDVFL